MMMAGPRLSYLFRPRYDRTGDAISAIILLEGPYSLILITRLISISMSPLMAIGIIGVRPPFFFCFFQPSSPGFEVEENLRIAFQCIGLRILVNRSIRRDTNVVKFVGRGDI